MKFMHQSKMILIVPLLFCSCSAPPLHGGRAFTSAYSHSLRQGDNASAPSRQSRSTLHTRAFTVPLALAPALHFDPDLKLTPPVSHQSSAVTLTETDQTADTTELGAAQKDTARELSARLGSRKGITWLGAGLFLFGLASAFWPPLRAIVGSLTTSAAVSLGGIALIVLPTLVAGHELLILGAVTALVIAWFLAHRHGAVRGELNALTTKSRKP